MHIPKLLIFYTLLISNVLFSAHAWAGEKLTKGSKWEVTGKIELPPGKAGIFYQHAKPVAAISGDQYSPWCRLVFKATSKEPRVISKGQYEITRVLYNDEAVNPTQISYKTTMRLKPIGSPGTAILHQIVCGRWDDNTGSYLSVKEIRQALEGVMRLEISTVKK